MLYVCLGVIALLIVALLAHLAHRRTVKVEGARINILGLFTVEAKKFETKCDEGKS